MNGSQKNGAAAEVTLGDYTLTFGAQNAFDDHPDKEKRGLILGWEYPEAAPLGFNGAFYYFKVGMEF